MRLATPLLAALVLLLSAGAAAQSPPVFSKAFAPSTIGPGSVSTLTFTIANTETLATLASGLTFTDVLPAGMTIATPAAATTTCLEDRSGPVAISAPEGGTTIAVSSAAVAGGATCQVSVNVTSATPGLSQNTSGDLLSSVGNSGPATAGLTVDIGRPGFAKAFSPATVVLGGRSTLTFTINNTANGSSASGLSFTDTLPAGMAVASPTNAATTCTGATVQATAGLNTITVPSFPSGSVPANQVCTVSVDVVTTAAGALGNVSGELTRTVGSPPMTISSGKASAVLTSVAGTLGLAKSFLRDPVPPGGTVPLEFTLRNIDRRGPANAVAFTDHLDGVVPGLRAAGPLPPSACGGTLSTPDGGATLEFSGGALASGEVCTFTVDVTVPADAPVGEHINVTSGISGEVLGDPVAGSAATAPLFIQPVPILTKTYLESPVSPGANVTLEFEITNSSQASQASSIAFSDDLGASLSLAVTVAGASTYGVVDEGPPQVFGLTSDGQGACGPGSDLRYDGGLLFLQDGLLEPAGNPGDSCTFSVVITLPSTLAGGTYVNTASEITAVIGGQTYTGAPATAVLDVLDGPELTKAFLESPVLPGAEVTLAFTLALSDDGVGGATDIGFTDDLGAALAGLAASPSVVFPVYACGGQLTATNSGQTLAFSGGSLTPGDTCELSVALTVPTTAGTGTYTNTTSELTSTVSGVALTGAAAEADLVVTQLAFAKVFTDDPVAPGGTVTLQYTLTNQSATDAATQIGFSDNYDDALEDLVATGAPAGLVCTSGAASLSGGSSVLTVSGASLDPGKTCTFSVTLSVPGSAVEDAYPSATSNLGATFNTQPVVIAPAIDDLVVETELPAVPPTLAAAFTPPTIGPGGTSQLVLTIDNALSGEAASALAVTATLATAVVIDSPSGAASTCGGTVTAAPGSNSLELSGGTVASGDTCTVSVAVTGSDLGMFLVNTTDLASSAGTSPSASAKLTIEDAVVTVTKADALDDADGDSQADAGETIAYTVVIEPAASLSRTVTFTDTPDPNTTIVPGSVAVNAGGSIVSGNGAGEGTLVVTFASLTETATLTFEVTVGGDYSEEAVEVCNQGTLTGDFSDVLSDDPGEDGFSATCTALAPPNRPPTADAGEDQTLECASPAGTPVTLDGSGSSDSDAGDVITYSWAIDATEVSTDAAPELTLPTGVTVVTLTVTDFYGETDTDEVEVTVEDTTPPVITLNGDAAVEVFRFSGAYIDLGATAEDLCEGPVAVTPSGAVDTFVPGVYTITYAATDAAGNAAEATRTVTVVDNPAAIASAYLFLVEKDLKIQEQLRTEGDVHSNDKLEFKKGIKPSDGGPSLHVGNATSSDDLKVHKDQRIEGDVRAPDVDLKNGAVVTGSVTEGPVATVPLPSVSVSASGPDVDVDEDGTVTLPPGSYGTLDVEEGGTVRLSTGAYTFEAIKLDDASRLEGDVSVGPITVDVQDKVDLKDGVVIVPTPFGEADARYLTFRVADGKVDLGEGSTVAAQIIAPASDVTIDKDTRFVGVVIAEKVDVKGGATALFVTAVPPASATTLLAEGDGAPADSEPSGTLDEEPTASDDLATAVAPQSRAIPEVFALGAAYPNPTDRSARVRYDVPEASAVRLEVYDSLGRRVAVLADGVAEAGSHEAVFYAHRLPAGTYLVRFTSEAGFAETRPVTVLR